VAGYQDMADGLLSLLRVKTPASVRVKTTNSNSKSDYRVLQNPTSGQAVVIVPAPFTRQRIEFQGGKSTDWNMDVQIFALVGASTENETHDLLLGFSQDVIDTIDAWPKLVATAGVYLAEVISGDEPLPLYAPDGTGPHWMMRTIRVSIQEDIEVSENE
jgi:hypothetical protein